MRSMFPWVPAPSRYALRVTVRLPKPDPKPEILTGWRPDTACRGRDRDQGRKNTAPFWDKPTKLVHATEIDPPKVQPRTDLGLGAWQKKMGLLK